MKLTDMKIVSEQPRDVIEALRLMQFNREEYDPFLRTLKRRLRDYTGKDEVLFYSEDEVVQLLKELKIIE